MSSYSNSSYSSPQDNDVDSSPAEPVEEGVDVTQSDDPTDNVGEGTSADADELADDELKHVDDTGSVIGRRNPDLETENFSVPSTK